MDREVTLCDLLQHLLLLSRLPWLQPSGRGILKLLRKHEGMASAPQPDGPEPTPVILGEEAHPAKDGFLYSLEAPPSGGRQAKGCSLGLPDCEGSSRTSSLPPASSTPLPSTGTS